VATADGIKGGNSMKLEKELLAQSLSCKEAAWTSGHALSASGSRRMKAHWRWRRLSLGCTVEAGALAR
jgi:hypothetical protein